MISHTIGPGISDEISLYFEFFIFFKNTPTVNMTTPPTSEGKSLSHIFSMSTLTQYTFEILNIFFNFPF